MSTMTPLIMGAVAYDPKVVTIWDGFQEYFRRHGLDFDYVLFSNYERQVEAHLSGQIHIAWNSPLAWLQSERVAGRLGRRAEAICMRDTDRDLTSIILVRSDSEIRTVRDLKGRTIAVGAKDSPQATLIPLSYLADNGVDPRADASVVFFDRIGGQARRPHRRRARMPPAPLLRGAADAACMIDANHLLFTREGTMPSGTTRVLAQTPPYDHCNFTVLDGAPRRPGDVVPRAAAAHVVRRRGRPAAARSRRTETVGAGPRRTVMRRSRPLSIASGRSTHSSMDFVARCA